MRLPLSAAALAAVVAVAGPLAAQTPRNALVIGGKIDDVVSLDPHESFEFTGSEFATQIYQKLVTTDPRNIGAILPGLAESWTVSDDGKVLTFKIRDGLKFHSGNPITAEDVAYSFKRIVNLNKSPAFIVTQFGINKDNVAETAKALDARTFQLTVDKSYATSFLLNCLQSAVGSIVDSKLVQSKEANGDWGNTWLKTNAAGSGPYTFGGWTANEQLVFNAHDGFAGDKPKLRRVIIRHMPEAATQRLALEKGDIDIARNLVGDHVASIEKNPDVKISVIPRSYVWYFSLNQKNPILAKPKVIEAMKHLVDYDGMAATVLARQFVVQQGYIPQGFLGAIKDRPYKLDVAKAKALLAEAGHPDGFKVTMDVTNTFPSTDMAQAIQATMAQAGVQLELIPGDFRATITKYRARNHDIYIGRWGADFLDPHSNADTFAKNEDNSDGARAKPLAWRNSWQDAELTQMTNAAMIERDADKRRALYEEAQRKFMARAPFTIMFQSAEIVASRKGVEGYYAGPTSETTWFQYVEKK